MHKDYKLNETLADIGEKELLNRLKKYMDKGQIDDDTATIPSSNEELIINHDVLVENVHFSDITTSPLDVGWKAVTANVSDLTSSGVNQVIGITIGLIAPSTTEWAWIDQVYKGMKTALNKYGGKILGGDCSKGNQKILSITAIGTLSCLRIHRSFALPGDYLVSTGPHGLSKLGLEILNSNRFIQKNNLSKALIASAIKAHKNPEPPIEALKKLIQCKPQNLPWRVGGTDSSDGLIEAIKCICSSSKCSAYISKKDLPRKDSWPKDGSWDEWLIEGGEDFELIASLPPAWAEAWMQTSPLIKVIGHIKKGDPKVFWTNGSEVKTNLETTFAHFS